MNEFELANASLIAPAPRFEGFNATFDAGESTVLKAKPFGGKKTATDATVWIKHVVEEGKSEGCLTSASYLLEKGLATIEGNKLKCAPFKCQWVNGEIID